MGMGPGGGGGGGALPLEAVQDARGEKTRKKGINIYQDWRGRGTRGSRKGVKVAKNWTKG